MKKYLLFYILLPLNCISQSFIDLYRIYDNNPLPVDVPVIIDGSINPYGMIYTLDEQNPISGGYSGEYMISLVDHLWNIELSSLQKAKSYKVEVVSFPFTMNCLDANGCSGPSTERKLFMPDEGINNSTKKWCELISINLMGNLQHLEDHQLVEPALRH